DRTCRKDRRTLFFYPFYTFYLFLIERLGLSTQDAQYTLRGEWNLAHSHPQRISHGISHRWSHGVEGNLLHRLGTKQPKGIFGLDKICLQFRHINGAKDTVVAQVGCE